MNKEFYLNPAQQKAYLIDAPYSVHILGRGTGKTEGILAPKIARRVVEMPRATRLLIAATFQQILTRTLPPLVAGWERIGYKLGVHYLVGEKPHEKWKKQWNWSGPMRPPFDWKYVISWWNGTIIQMVSQDRIGSTNGMSVDGIDGDEAKLLNYERLTSETFPANRGPVKAFEGNPHHHGWTFTSDMPVGTSGRWLLDFRQQVNTAKIEQILEIAVVISQKQEQLANTSSTSGRLRLEKELQLLYRFANEIRVDALFVQMGSSLQNLAALGVKYIKQMVRDLPENELKAAILNIEPKTVEGCFYPDLNEEHHGYFAYNYSEFEKTGYKLDQLKDNDNASIDSDYSSDMPLHICLDYNNRITPMVVVQMHDNEIRAINSFYSLAPQKLNDTLLKFCKYYMYHNNKTVYYWHDHTTENEYAHTTGTQSQEVIQYLRSNGWHVIEKYIGKASNHSKRYSVYANLLSENETYPYVFRYNRDRCKFLAISMYNTGTMKAKNGFGKDKRSELKNNFPAEESSHFGEALDMLIYGVLESGLSFINTSGNFSGIITL